MEQNASNYHEKGPEILVISFTLCRQHEKNQIKPCQLQCKLPGMMQCTVVTPSKEVIEVMKYSRIDQAVPFKKSFKKIIM